VTTQGAVMSFWTRRRMSGSRATVVLAVASSVFTALVAVAPAEAGARGRAPWCGNLSGHSLDDCNYFTFQQCIVSVHGLGGICARNPAAVAYEPAPRHRQRRAHRSGY
jgi:hypothetical protein